MERIEEEIEVKAPLRAVYDQWTQFEDFPKFMEGVKEVRQLDERRLFWCAEILGQEAKWEAIIDEQIPDERIAWRSITGHPNSGAVYFAPRGPEITHVKLVMSYQPLGAAEKVADALGVLTMRVKGDLARFRKFIEARGASTGAWRGEIREGTRTASR